METWCYRIIAPRKDFVSTISSSESAVMAEHGAYVATLREEGRLLFVGRCENGDWGQIVFSAMDEAAARAVAEGDPAVSAGLMGCELRAFKVILGGA